MMRYSVEGVAFSEEFGKGAVLGRLPASLWVFSIAGSIESMLMCQNRSSLSVVVVAKSAHCQGLRRRAAHGDRVQRH